MFTSFDVRVYAENTLSSTSFYVIFIFLYTLHHLFTHKLLSRLSHFFSTSINSLPDDIIFREVLLRVPGHTLPKLKCVSKQWNKTISDPWFVHLHLQRWRSLPPGCISFDAGYFYSDNTENIFDMKLHEMLNEESLVLMSSCDGLLLVGTADADKLGDDCDDSYYIVNPVTRFSTKVPYPPKEIDDKFEFLQLVFDNSIHQYKTLAWRLKPDADDYEDEDVEVEVEVGVEVEVEVEVNHSVRNTGSFLGYYSNKMWEYLSPYFIPTARIIPNDGGRIHSPNVGLTFQSTPHYHELLVLTLGGTCSRKASWRELRLPERCQAGFEPVDYKGKVYWISYLKSTKRHTILSVDIASEKLEEIAMPNLDKFDLDSWSSLKKLKMSLRLMVVRGFLYLVFGSLDYHCYIIWILEYIEKPIWTKLHQKKYGMNHDSCCACSSDSDYTMVHGFRELTLRELESQARKEGTIHFNSLVCLENIQSRDAPVNSSDGN